MAAISGSARGNFVNSACSYIFQASVLNDARLRGSSYDAAGWDMNLNGINYAGGQAFITFMVSDGQNFAPNDDGTITINGIPLVSGGIFQGSSLCCGTGPTHNGNLWDIESFDITSFLTLGNNNLHIVLGPGFNDALADIVAAVDLPAGAAPPLNAPEPITLSLFGAGLAGAVAMRRRRKTIA
ncbi:MAG: PEP-CTERM sorting domain-containing protein [Rhizomicrobium sp.]